MLISSGFTKLGIFCLNLPYHIILSLFTLQYVIGNLVESIEKILPRKIYSLRLSTTFVSSVCFILNYRNSIRMRQIRVISDANNETLEFPSWR